MKSGNTISSSQNTLIIFFVFAVFASASASALFRVWAVFGIPVGLLLGFFLQKGDLCGSSAFSEVILLRDYKKVFGFWIGIVFTMAGIAILDVFDMVVLNPKPLLYLSVIIGGIIFGSGTVLAGGCVSGCLYKAGSGNLNSMAALAGIPIGVAMIEFGPLSTFQSALKTFIIKPETGKSVTLSSLTGAPYWILALIILFFTIIIVIYRSKNKVYIKQELSEKSDSLAHKIFLRSWKPWQAGIAIGLLVIPAYLSSASSGRNYPLGVTHGVLQAELLATEKHFNHIWGNQITAAQESTSGNPANDQIQQVREPQGKKIVWWLVFLVVSLVAGSFVSAKLSGQAKLLPKQPEQTVIAFFGGILVGGGAALGGGCVIGNILSGGALMSAGAILFGIFTILSNWGMTYLYLMGGKVSRST